MTLPASSPPANQLQSQSGVSRLHSLDALRGLAALSVVLWHWSAFPVVSEAGAAFQVSAQPCYQVFFPFYLEGYRAVDLFFSLSGFVFYWLYQEKVTRRGITVADFSVLRLSRLYPLHLLTLLVVAVGQAYMRWKHDLDFLYVYNDLRHFMLQLFMASNWGFESGFSFNGPVWSISVEVLLYALFFLLCRLQLTRWWHLALLVMTGLFLSVFVSDAIGAGMTGFFAGGLAFYAFGPLRKHRRWLPLLASVTLLLWFLIPWNARQHLLLDLYEQSPFKVTVMASGRDVVSSIVERMCGYLYSLVLFPMTILCLALWEQGRSLPLKGVAWLGDLSYASYLWHFPLQIVFFALALAFGHDWKIFMSPWMMGLFFVVLTLWSLMSYHLFERPAQQWIRQKWTAWKSKARAAPAAG